MNGFYVGAWAPKIPEFAERLSLSKSTLGLMILLVGLGSVTLMPVAGALNLIGPSQAIASDSDGALYLSTGNGQNDRLLRLQAK